ncbi:class I SAM-dependent methyltransferase [Desulfovibrio psychrotolerans]|uniref:Methyltransferase domain-containing protein n=1 Tax=Desulfovibrio psychrotolerans TaxID=415242 RepID=A0A7J0BR98_9BACT|nr:class I SAM-dependent methyltransferase [Desulfovibrio psychrotolerans]GFM35665.1 hypothetical protein DSM19430T_03490 [Desulfovibrio psychrotolerans]
MLKILKKIYKSKFAIFIRTSRLYGYMHSKYYFKKNRHHVVQFPELNGKIIDRWEDLKEASRLKHLYQEKIYSFLSGKNHDEVVIIGCSFGHEVVHTHKQFPNTKIIGIDIDKECIQFCKSLSIPDCEFYEADVTNKELLEKIFPDDGKSRVVISFETIYFISPSGIKVMFDFFAKGGVKDILIHTNTNINNTGFNLFSCKKSKYSGIQGAWDHAMLNIPNYFPYHIQLLDQRLRATSVHYYQEPWLISYRLNGSWNDFFFDQTE